MTRPEPRKWRKLGTPSLIGGERRPLPDALRTWAKKLMETKPFKLVAVALANKMARIVFAILRNGASYAAAAA